MLQIGFRRSGASRGQAFGVAAGESLAGTIKGKDDHDNNNNKNTIRLLLLSLASYMSAQW